MAQKKGVAEVFDLLKDYARQELIDPLKPAPRWLAMGVAGSLMLIVGSILLLLALLRGLQTETGSAMTGNLSWITVPDRNVRCGRGDCASGSSDQQEEHRVSTAEDEPITRDSIEGAFQDLQRDVDDSTRGAMAKLIPGIAIGAILLALLAYFLGKRVGRTKSTVVEIRRI